jgi:hypothetical protein
MKKIVILRRRRLPSKDATMSCGTETCRAATGIGAGDAAIATRGLAPNGSEGAARIAGAWEGFA